MTAAKAGLCDTDLPDGGPMHPPGHGKGQPSPHDGGHGSHRGPPEAASQWPARATATASKTPWSAFVEMCELAEKRSKRSQKMALVRKMLDAFGRVNAFALLRLMLPHVSERSRAVVCNGVRWF